MGVPIIHSPLKKLFLLFSKGSKKFHVLFKHFTFLNCLTYYFTLSEVLKHFQNQKTGIRIVTVYYNKKFYCFLHHWQDWQVNCFISVKLLCLIFEKSLRVNRNFAFFVYLSLLFKFYLTSRGGFFQLSFAEYEICIDFLLLAL